MNPKQTNPQPGNASSTIDVGAVFDSTYEHIKKIALAKLEARDKIEKLHFVHTAEIIPLNIFTPDGVRLYFSFIQYNSLVDASLRITSENVPLLDFLVFEHNEDIFIPMQHKIIPPDTELNPAAAHLLYIQNSIFLELATCYAFRNWYETQEILNPKTKD